MIYIEVNANDVVKFRHDFPFDPIRGLNKTRHELLISGFLIEKPEEAEHIEDKIVIEKFNGTTFYYEYVDIPRTKEELLREKVELLENAIAELTFLVSLNLN